MARPKTMKYFLTVEAIDTVLIDNMELTKKAFVQREEELTAAITASQNDEYPLEVDWQNDKYDLGAYTISEAVYTLGTTRVVLSIHTCKYGYWFT